MSSQQEFIHGLEQASQKHEKEIVIELGKDRLLHYFGVYLIILLAAIAKISELAGKNLSCYPGNNATDVSGDFISYATTYCWETSDLVVPNPTQTNKNSCITDPKKRLLNNPSKVKTFIQYLPYVMFLEAFLLALPAVWWHYKVGARLMGHLKFMRILLNDVYEGMKKIPVGNFRNVPYDKKSYYLDGTLSYDPEYKNEEDETTEDSNNQEADKATIFQHIRRRFKKKEPSTPPQAKYTSPLMKSGSGSTVVEVTQTNTQQNETTEEEEEDDDPPRSIFIKEMLDRHFFSLLCFENFSSLEYHPYLLSIYRLTWMEKDGESPKGSMSMRQGILRQLCHKDNFSGKLLVRSYIKKHLLGIFLSLALLVLEIIFIVNLGSDGWRAETFRCDVINYEYMCVICTLHRKSDVFIFMGLNLAVLSGYFVLSCKQFIFVFVSGDRANCFYFEDIDDSCSCALLAVHKQEEKARKANA